jgi:hypothetical protein
MLRLFAAGSVYRLSIFVVNSDLSSDFYFFIFRF